MAMHPSNPAADAESCRQLANKIRLHVLNMTHAARSSHIGSSFSNAEILAVLYKNILRVVPDKPDDPARDRFVMSKGHACAGLYAVLAESGFFPVEWLKSFYVNGARLAGHATKGIPGIEVSTGSLGHGLPIAAGMAYAGKKSASPYRVFAMLSDGECDEGSNWEAALFAGHHRLDNLTVIVDYNKIQSLGHVKDVLDLEPLADKWSAFRWETREIDGHDLGAIDAALKRLPFAAGKPSCLIAHTVKGKGVSFMEDKLLWHYRTPQDEEYESALKELQAQS
jgi:transketolase